jgi:hypothetical protein
MQGFAALAVNQEPEFRGIIDATFETSMVRLMRWLAAEIDRPKAAIG